MNNSFKPDKNNAIIPTVTDGQMDNSDLSLDNNERIEVIVKFSGDILKISRNLQAEVEILLQGYAIITIDKANISQLYSYTQIESIELPNNLYITSQYNLISSCIRSVHMVLILF